MPPMSRVYKDSLKYISLCLDSESVSVAILCNYSEQKLPAMGNDCLQYVICLPDKLIWALTFGRKVWEDELFIGGVSAADTT